MTNRMMMTDKARPNPLQRMAFETISVAPITGTIGAEIGNVDLNDLSDRQIAEIKAAFGQYLVLVFRGQQALTPENHIRFAGLFGEIQPITHLDHVPGFPDIQPIHRDADDKRRVTGELFHSDSTYLDKPPHAVAMQAITLPPFGGDTAFANLQLAYSTLSPRLQEMLETLNVVHSARRLFGRAADQSRVNMKEMDPEEGEREVIHPLVVTHPFSGHKSIFVNPAYSIRIDGMTDAESAPLMDFLYQHCTFIPLTMRVRWEVGTLVLWDNWGAYHSAIGDYEGYQRTLHRVTVGGFRPQR